MIYAYVIKIKLEFHLASKQSSLQLLPSNERLPTMVSTSQKNTQPPALELSRADHGEAYTFLFLSSKRLIPGHIW